MARKGFEGAPGGLDPEVLVGMQLAHARSVLREGDPARALVEAEQVLDQDPERPEALALVGEAALAAGDGLLARLLWQARLDGAPADGQAAHRLALALVLDGDALGARAALDRAITLEPDVALAHHLRARCLRLLGEPGAEVDDAVAHRLDPTGFPLPRPPSAARWRSALDRARAELADMFEGALDGTAIELKARPDLQALRQEPPPRSLLAPARAFDEGTVPEDAPPSRIELYAEALGWPPCGTPELARRLVDAVVDVLPPGLEPFDLGEGLPPFDEDD